MQAKPIRLRVTRDCLIRGVPCDAGTLIEGDSEMAADLLMSASAAIDGPIPASVRITPAIAWREPDVERAPSFRIVTDPLTVLAANGASAE